MRCPLAAGACHVLTHCCAGLDSFTAHEVISVVKTLVSLTIGKAGS